MKQKLVGLCICMLMIVPALPAAAIPFVSETNERTAMLTRNILWDNGLPNGYFALSSQYKPTTQSSLEVVADVDAVKTWVITGGDFRIIINYVGGPAAITGVNVFVYKNQDDNTPAMARYAERTATIFVGTYTGDSYFGMSEVLMNVTFNPVSLPPGKWWICFQPVIDWDMYWLASNLTGLGCFVSWPDLGYPRWTDDNDLPLIGEDIDVSFRLFGFIAQPPNPPTINGPVNGKVGTNYPYNFTSTDPDADDVYYFIDWGDGINSSWLGPYASGATITQFHAWTTKGSYIIRAKARDIHGNESDWSTLSVSMPLSYQPHQFKVFAWVLQRFPHAFPILRHLLGY